MKNKSTFMLALDINDDEAVYIGIKKDDEIKDFVELNEAEVIETINVLQEWVTARQDVIYHTPSLAIQ